MNSTKKWYQSKTVWSGILKALAGLIVMIADLASGDVNFQAFLPGAVASIWGIYDIVIRFKTDTPVN